MTREARVLLLGALAGAALALIGVRFLVSPEAAARFFGVGARPTGHQLYQIVALRDLWLGGLAVGLAVLGERRALGLWLGLGALVCVADAAIVAATAPKAGPLAFHLASGVFCAVVARFCFKPR